MDHVAIMYPQWGLLPRILSGEKVVESRWYKRRYAPWNRIHAGDRVYFKDAGKPVTLVAEVNRVLQFANLTLDKIIEILHQYGREDGLRIDDIPKFIELFKNKKYCILVFLINPREIEPFNINKKGFGMGNAWLIVDSINRIKR